MTLNFFSWNLVTKVPDFAPFQESQVQINFSIGHHSDQILWKKKVQGHKVPVRWFNRHLGDQIPWKKVQGHKVMPNWLNKSMPKSNY